MVKVLKDNSGWQWVTFCRSKGCGSNLAATVQDVKYGTSGMDAGDPRYYIVCPICKTQNLVPRELETDYLFAALAARRAKRRS